MTSGNRQEFDVGIRNSHDINWGINGNESINLKLFTSVVGLSGV